MAKVKLDRLEEATLALLTLTTFEDSFNGITNTRAWKNHSWEIMDSLHEAGFISNPKGKARSVMLTPEGLAEAKRLFSELFDD